MRFTPWIFSVKVVLTFSTYTLADVYLNVFISNITLLVQVRIKWRIANITHTLRNLTLSQRSQCQPLTRKTEIAARLLHFQIVTRKKTPRQSAREKNSS